MEVLRCLAVDVGNGNPIAIHARVTEALKHELGEVMRSVHVTTWLEAGSDCARYLSLEAVREALDEPRDFISPDGALIMRIDALKNRCGMWAIDRAFRESYDAFLSYRWSAPPEFTVDAQFADAPLTQAIFDQLTSHNVTPEHRPIVVFKDTECMRNGEDFLDSFSRALVHSRVVVPLVSEYALHRMGRHDPTKVDYTLLEWVMALVCCEADTTKRVLPILLGQCVSGDSEGRRTSLQLDIQSFPGDVHCVYIMASHPPLVCVCVCVCVCACVCVCVQISSHSRR
jgi:hypothetical protein